MSAFGLTFLLDSQARIYRSGLPVYYRTKNFNQANTLAGEMGFKVADVNASTNDSMVCPQPAIAIMSSRMLQEAIANGVALRAGARVLTISQTWVAQIQVANNFANPRQVFNDNSVVGFVSDGLLFQPVTLDHVDLYGAIISWNVNCNANEIK